MKIILDTSVVLGPAMDDIDEDIATGEIAISAATLAELHFGVLVARSADTRAERLRRLSVIEHTFDALPVDHEVARQYGRIAAAVAEVGRQPRARVMDLLIAATAVAHGARLYTRNAADLVGLDGIVDVVAVGRQTG